MIQLLNVIEPLAAEHAALRVGIWRLRDENVWLKARSGKSNIKPPTPPPPPPADHSSEAERRTHTHRGKSRTNEGLIVTQEERYVVDSSDSVP